jgi:hypothetical protein
MNDLGMKWNSSYKKCARIVGEVLGKYILTETVQYTTHCKDGTDIFT